uniref:Uncharacterized protein n=1 Tax=Catharus ustulatus TaxID=91951 RepID=A0A8C3TNK0_CATUS
MHICIFCVFLCTHTHIHIMYVCMHVCMYVCVSLSLSFYIYTYACVCVCVYICIAVRAGGQRGCQPSADAGGPRAAGRGNAGRSAGSAGPPAAPETRSPGGDVSGFPSDRRAGASQSPAPVRSPGEEDETAGRKIGTLTRVRLSCRRPSHPRLPGGSGGAVCLPAGAPGTRAAPGLPAGERPRLLRADPPLV